jgi:Ca2+-transporting ATPase
MIDPPRVEVAELVKQCHQSGIKVVMITGDHIDTAKAVATEIGIIGEALTGEQLDKLSDEELVKKAEQVVIYARVNPAFKMKIVNALKQNGHIVAMTGDGVNDAPALKKADIGIAMGITGTDVAKEASDMVLMDDHFSTIVKAIQEGRGIFQNIRKFVNYLLSCNIGEVFLVFFAVILFKELPLSATMLLWVNVVTDGLPAIALGLDPGGKDIMNQSPKQFQTDIVSKRMWLDMVIFGILMTAVVLFIYWINLPSGVEEAKAAAFTSLVVLEMVRLFLIRSEFKTKFWSNYWLILAVVGTILMQVALIYIPWIAQLFEIRHFDAINWLYITVGSVLMWIIFKVGQYQRSNRRCLKSFFLLEFHVLSKGTNEVILCIAKSLCDGTTPHLEVSHSFLAVQLYTWINFHCSSKRPGAS